ncbi:hypothetical protein J0S82_014287 [Galemys pyrenaicus]|uniref:Uncharacterized protein n=1 Tax=Galemys pyrenaicus TaxID=202257 RepID=A0A8J6A458_GALPY|nr:hypothetical protein J0S82_014287 [Galemys pyrenaicus]
MSLGEKKEDMSIIEALETLGSDMARPARRSPLLTVDKSNKFDLCPHDAAPIGPESQPRCTYLRMSAPYFRCPPSGMRAGPQGGTT